MTTSAEDDHAKTRWMKLANCAGLPADLFFGEPGQGGNTSVDAGRQVCAGCVVRDDCLEYVLGMPSSPHEPPGLWGGTTPRERRAIRKSRAAATLNPMSRPD